MVPTITTAVQSWPHQFSHYRTNFSAPKTNMPANPETQIRVKNTKKL